MLTFGAGTKRGLLAGLMLLGLTACGSDDTAQVAGTGNGSGDTNIANTNPGDIGGNPLGADQVFNNEIGNTVYFATDRYDLSTDAQSVLTRQAQWLQQYPVRTAVIEGHGDERGTREYNLALGERRAESARAYLVALGVDAARLQTTSFGKEQPLCAESEEGCWERNRRAVTALNP
ncbi:peptidoglycan-associated lipoprotein Pal [Dongia sp.]|uniref:peptidoglycan-associated lipoprotein Pal n=1 Tax=Dongia sp. TaxID=1977262 RepID=UPI0035B1CF9B